VDAKARSSKRKFACLKGLKSPDGGGKSLSKSPSSSHLKISFQKKNAQKSQRPRTVSDWGPLAYG
jgi:hypothetical protein